MTFDFTHVVSRFTTSTLKLVSASKCSTPTEHWKVSADVALVCFGGVCVPRT